MEYTHQSTILDCESVNTLNTPFTYHNSRSAVAMKNGLLEMNVASVEISDVSDRDSSTGIELDLASTSLLSSVDNDVIQTIFEESKSRWIDDPVISQWRSPEHKIYGVLSEMNDLYNNWGRVQPAPFALSSDPIWLDTGRILAGAGLPWSNNQINMPNEIDSSFPFHFKEFESQLIRTKGALVGDPNPSGYVTSYAEANLWCIRALQQELREQFPTMKPMLVCDHFDSEVMVASRKLFGLEVLRVDLSGTMESLRQELRGPTSDGIRPIIFAATLYSSTAEHDDLSTISQLSEEFPLILHVDAFRSFDYIHADDRRHDGVKLKLAPRNFERPLRADDKSILASTIVAGGLNHSRHHPAIAMKPASLGEKPRRVTYIRSFDSTLSGSRDCIAILWLALYHRRLGENGLRELSEYLISLRSFVLRALGQQNILAVMSPYSTDLLVRSCTQSQRKWLLGLGGTVTAKGEIVLSMNLGFSAVRLRSLLDPKALVHSVNFTDDPLPAYKEFLLLYPMPQHVVNAIETKVQSWQVMTRSSAGYPFHMGSGSALGPVIGLFWNLDLPKDWVHRRSQEIVTASMKAFGLVSPESRKDFRGAFTNGSTMGNRCGIMTALEHFPNAFVYFSAETHYSVMKTVRDCDTLTNRWAGGKPRYSEILCASDGSILVEALVEQAVADRQQCVDEGVEYHMVLFTNMGTTFVGARDDLVSIYRGLQKKGIWISYIHADGALDFGFETCGIKLGPCGAVDEAGMPVLQGITISHHKALGSMVSGRVICLSPENQLSNVCPDVGPRAVFEAWFYSRVYGPDDLALMLKYCHANASRLQAGLGRIGVVVKRNIHSVITVFERPPSWLIEEYSLRPEGGWVHFITMPHVSTETVDCFIDDLSFVDRQFSYAFGTVAPLLSECLRRPVELRRVGCCSPLAERVVKLEESLVPPSDLRSPNTGSVFSVKLKLRGAVSAVVVDEQDEIQVVFLADSNRNQSITVDAILIRKDSVHRKGGIVRIAKLFMGLLARRLKAKTNENSLSYAIHPF